MKHGAKMLATQVVAVCALVGVAVASAPSDPGSPEDTDAQRPADNSGQNVRDRSQGEPTADQQPNDVNDRRMTQAIRKAVVADHSLSTNAHNVKIITQSGIVTLRGPVKSEGERQAIEKKAGKVPGVKRVDNRLEIAS